MFRCLVYIDLNTVRAGVVSHPSEWPFGGFCEIQEPKRKCRLIAHEHLLSLLGCASHDQLKEVHAYLIEERLRQRDYSREVKGSASVGVGSEEFVLKVKNELGVRAQWRKVIGKTVVDCVLREPEASYLLPFGPENENIGSDNVIMWNNYSEILVQRAALVRPQRVSVQRARCLAWVTACEVAVARSGDKSHPCLRPDSGSGANYPQILRKKL